MKLYFASESERRAVSWVQSSYGRTWRKDLAQTVSEGERSFPFPNMKHFVSRPFGRPDFNSMNALARNCYRRNLYFRDLAKRMSV